MGSAVGAAVAAVAASVLGGLAWWGWVALILAGLVIGLGYAALRRRATVAEPAPEQ